MWNYYYAVIISDIWQGSEPSQRMNHLSCRMWEKRASVAVLIRRYLNTQRIFFRYGM